MARRLIWRVVALLALAAGLIGVVLPVVPTVPFVLLAAWAAGKGWPQLEAHLLAHPVYGEHIRNWRMYGAVSRRTKWIATAMMLVSAAILQISAAPLWLRVAVPTFLLGVAVWLWRRPEHGPASAQANEADS